MARSYAKTGRINRLAYMCRYSGVLTLYGVEKKARVNGHWEVESSITLRRYRVAVQAYKRSNQITSNFICSTTYEEEADKNKKLTK